MKDKKCHRCKKPCLGYLCWDCYRKKGYSLSRLKIQKRYREKNEHNTS